MTEAATAAAVRAKARRARERLEDVEWLIDQGATLWEVQEAMGNVNLQSIERAALRAGDKNLATRIRRLISDARYAA